ncbi:MAG: hypothetical protein KJ048_12135 [Dehalococcoidia bacterium]|nr:hypothetical protein [Dehalococcoidia bacterium]
MLHDETSPPAPILSRVLWGDVAFEAFAGAVLLATATFADRWFDLSTATLYVAAALFFVAAVAILPLARADEPSRQAVTGLASANIAGGALGWLALLLWWDRFEGEGRWLLAFAADAFIVLGAAELIALRRRR